MNPPNIILVVLDTLGKNTLYSQVDQTVAFRKLVEDGVVYKNAIAPSSWTVPSHGSMFTGLYPSEHGVIQKEKNEDLSVVLQRSFDIYDPLSQILRGNGYSTLSFSANLLVSSGTGFEKGFDICEPSDVSKRLEITNREFHELIKFGREGVLANAMDFFKDGNISNLTKLIKLNADLRKYLKELKYPANKDASGVIRKFTQSNKREPFFAFLNFMEAHEPYKKVPIIPINYQEREARKYSLDWFNLKKIRKRQIEYFRAKYRESVHTIDEELSKLLKYLNENSLYDNTMIIITSDHGQAFGENRFIGHGHFLFDELIQIPLLIKYPNSHKYMVSEGYQTLVDIFEFLKSWGNNMQYAFPSRELVFSEVRGMKFPETTPKKYWDQNDNEDRRALFKDRMKIVVNGTRGVVEEFTINGLSSEVGKHKDDARKLIEELEIFVGSNKFNMPVI